MLTFTFIIASLIFLVTGGAVLFLCMWNHYQEALFTFVIGVVVAVIIGGLPLAVENQRKEQNAMNKKKYVKISVDELAELIEAKEELSALECGGIDNWEWYGECYGQYIEDSEFEDWDDYIESCTSEENILKEYEQVD